MSAYVIGPSEPWERETGVTCVVCPACAFTFDECHVTDATGRYDCPECGYPDASVVPVDGTKEDLGGDKVAQVKAEDARVREAAERAQTLRRFIDADPAGQGGGFLDEFSADVLVLVARLDTLSRELREARWGCRYAEAARDGAVERATAAEAECDEWQATAETLQEADTMSRLYVSEKERADRAEAEVETLRMNARALLDDFLWLNEQHPEHNGAYADYRVALMEAALGSVGEQT